MQVKLVRVCGGLTLSTRGTPSAPKLPIDLLDPVGNAVPVPVNNALDPLHPLDVLRSARWSRALIGTYVMSLGFFEAAPLRALRRGGATDIRILADVAGVAGALGEAGAREVGRTYAVEPVRVTDGCFHPKFLLLDGDTGPRMLVGSGNLTFGGWGSNLELAETMSPATHPGAFGDMAVFLDALATTHRAVSAAGSTLRSWAAALRRVGEPDPAAAVRVMHNVDRPMADQLVEEAARLGGARKLLVASPYFGGARAVRRLADALGVDRVEVHVPRDVAVAGRCFDFSREPSFAAVVVDSLAVGGDARPLHAKLIEIECAGATLTMSGSVNASGPALLSTGNVELAVLRVSAAPRATTAFVGDLPVFGSVDAESSAEAIAVLTSTLLGDRLDGTVLSPGCEGTWAARLDAVGEFLDLGDTMVEANGAFSIQVKAAELVGYGSRRAVLTLARAGDRARGFVTFPDLIELSRRFGTGVVGLLRVAGGSEEDEDLVGLLEYLASHPDDTVGAWRGNAQRKAADGVPDGRSVALSDLDVRPRTESMGGRSSQFPASAIERLLRAFRGHSRKGSTGGGWNAAAEEDDATSGGDGHGRSPGRTEGVFLALREVLGGKVPAEPAAELHRLGEIGVLVLARRPDAERLAEFAEWWSGLAVEHLRGARAEPNLARLAAAFILIEALPGRHAARARHRLAIILGEVGPTLDALTDGECGKLEALIDAAGPGMAALLEFAEAVRGEVSPFEELPVLVRAIRDGVVPPPLARLDREPETALVRVAIAAGRAHRLPIAQPGATSCPHDNMRFAAAEIERIRTVGMVVARNCCGRVVVIDPDDVG